METDLGLGVGAGSGGLKPHMRAGDLLAFDSFDRADTLLGLGVADSGHTWEEYDTPNNWSIDANRANQRDANAPGKAVLDAGTADCRVKFDLIMPEMHREAAFTLRALDVGNLLYLRHTQSVTILYKKDAGSQAELVRADVPAAPLNVWFPMEAVLDGGNIQIIRDGVVILAHTLTAAEQTKYGVYTKHGMFSWSNGAYFDNFVIEAI